jgi:hypothetical protein
MRHRTSPWGTVNTQQTLACVDGHYIDLVSTPSHGGAYVPDALLHYIPEAEQLEAARWSGSRNWYEEDCCIESVAKAFKLRPAGENL